MDYSIHTVEYQSVFSFVGIGSPHPLPPASVSIPLDPRGEQRSLAGEGFGGDPIWTTGQKAWHYVNSVVTFFSSAKDAGVER